MNHSGQVRILGDQLRCGLCGGFRVAKALGVEHHRTAAVLDDPFSHGFGKPEPVPGNRNGGAVKKIGPFGRRGSGRGANLEPVNRRRRVHIGIGRNR